MEVSGQLHVSVVLPRYQLDRRLSGPQGRSGQGDEDRKYQPLPRIENQSLELVAVLTACRHGS
jgi:hypothetical protein